MAQDVIDLDQFKTVEELRRELVALKRENIAALKTVDRLLKDLNKKVEEITHLQILVSNTVPVVIPEKDLHVDSAEEIAQVQLDRLREASKKRVLTLEEVRMYDLLVKNKHITKEKINSTVQAGSFRDVSDIELEKLLDKPSETGKNQ